MQSRFIYPGRPIRAYSVSAIPENYMFQIKKDGHRVIIVCDGHDIVFYNRHGKKLSSIIKYEDKWKFISSIFPAPFVLDGELVGPRQAGSKSDIIYLWDCPVMDGRNLMKCPYIDRYMSLMNYSSNIVSNSSISIANKNGMSVELSLIKTYNEFYCAFNSLIKDEDEGVVFKNTRSSLYWSAIRPGDDPNQIKIKRN